MSGGFLQQNVIMKWRPILQDLTITIILWSYYTAGFILFFAPFYLLAYCFSGDRQRAFQKLNHLFYKGFFGLVKGLIPACRWEIPAEVREIQSSVIVCNHRSYIDPILLISLFPRHTTIAKARLFRIPIFGKMLTLSGYIPSKAEGRLGDLMIDLMERMPEFMDSGGNAFIFPEGTRTRDGHIGSLNKGAFKIARMCRATVTVLFMENTDKLLAPGKFLFNTRSPNRVILTKISEIRPDYGSDDFTINGLMRDIHGLLVKKNISNGS